MPRPEGVVRRSAEWIDREYGVEKWPAIEALVEHATGSGRRELGEVVLDVARRELGDSGGLQPREVMLGGSALTAPAGVALGAHQHLVTESLLAHCTPTTDLVIELGAGWGRNLCLAWLSGAPRDARYVAAEYTVSGCRVVERLSGLAPEFALEARRFDLRAPSLADLVGCRQAVVLTVHAVEQVDMAPPELIDEILALAPQVTCVHLESVGWQIGASQGSSEAYALANDYNRNLMPLLIAAQDRGAIEILTREIDVVGMNPRNATSMVVWRATQATT